ncbi:MAG: hypothetical protein IJ764_06040 [Bacteroidales bacterium]|nr:hypothetical protein [Bacteroidales bacterium]
MDFLFRSRQQVLDKVLEWGFLPFFKNGIDGFSIAEHTPEELWFEKDVEGPWEWKGPIIGEWQCAYGKFFAGKAGFVSLEWLPDFINWRRFARPLTVLGGDAQHILTVLRQNETLLSHELKKASGYSLSRRRWKGAEQDKERVEKTGAECDSLLNALEMSTYVCIADFEYKYTRAGERYGWGVARYCTPEAMYGDGIVHCERMPEESRQRIANHLQALFPQATARQIEKMI